MKFSGSRAGRVAEMAGLIVGSRVSHSPKSVSCSFSPGRRPVKRICTSRKMQLLGVPAHEVDDPDRLAHVEHEGLAVLGHGRRRQDEADGFLDGHEEARDARDGSP